MPDRLTRPAHVALRAALFSIGFPRYNVVDYETYVKADQFLVMARGPAEEMTRAKTILGTFKPSRADENVTALAAEQIIRTAQPLPCLRDEGCHDHHRILIARCTRA